MNTKKIANISKKQQNNEKAYKSRVFCKLSKYIIILFSLIIAVATVIYSTAAVLSYNIMDSDVVLQRDRIAELEGGASTPVDESAFADFDLSANDPKINRVRTLNTHNSYRKRLNWYSDFLIGTFLPKSLYQELNYEHGTLTDQLNRGIRGMELDLHSSGGKFSVYHISKLDYGSAAPDFELALKELKIWSDNNPDHVPVTVLLEYKTESFFLDWAADKPDENMLKRLDETVLNVIGRQKLITPTDIIGGYLNMQSAVAADNWPLLSETRGKFVFLLHYSDELTKKYIGLDESLKSLALFPTVQIQSGDDKALEQYREYASYILYNTPSVKDIDELVSAGYIVRTRADADMRHPPENRDAALSSLAQIITTDYEKGRILPISSYYVDFGDGKTMSLLSF